MQKNSQIPATGRKTCFETSYKNCDANEAHQTVGRKHLLLNLDDHTLVARQRRRASIRHLADDMDSFPFASITGHRE